MVYMNTRHQPKENRYVYERLTLVLPQSVADSLKVFSRLVLDRATAAELR